MNLLISSLCLFIIFMLIIILNLKRKLLILKRQFSNEKNGVSGKDLFENITKSKILYKDLLIEFHPDKFILDENKKIQAELLCSKIAENKSSYRELFSIAKSVKNDFEFSQKFITNHPTIFE
jgi:hypothetical protein